MVVQKQLAHGNSGNVGFSESDSPLPENYCSIITAIDIIISSLQHDTTISCKGAGAILLLEMKKKCIDTKTCISLYFPNKQNLKREPFFF